jgi:peptide/nickel transport system permease protein
MVAFLIRRTFGMIVVLIAVSLVTYIIFFKIPGGNPALRIAGRTATQANIKSIEDKLGLNHHGITGFFFQWWSMMKALLSGTLISYYDGTNVVQQIKAGMPATFSLCIGAGIIWLGFGILVGTISAVTAGGFSDKSITALALIGISLPVAWLGLLLRYFLTGEQTNGISLFPDGGYVPLTQNPWQWFYHLLLPWFTLAILFIGFYGRVLRSNILDTINEDFVRTAKAKGLSSRRILVKHTLRASLIPIVTLFGLDFAAVLGGGAIITETVYSIPGVGYYAYQSIQTQDLPPLMGVTLYGAAFIVVFSTLVDVAYAYLDPRIRLT